MKSSPHTEAWLEAYRKHVRHALEKAGTTEGDAFIHDQLFPQIETLRHTLREAEKLLRVVMEAHTALTSEPMIKQMTAQSGMFRISAGGVLRRALDSTGPAMGNTNSYVHTPGRKSRSIVIKTFAAAMPKAKDGVHVREVAKELESQGVNLGTPVPGTMIGNVLNKSEEWERVEKGIFRYVGKKK